MTDEEFERRRACLLLVLITVLFFGSVAFILYWLACWVLGVIE